MKLTYNGLMVTSSGGGVQLKFATKPQDHVRDALKRNGYRWFGAIQSWCHHRPGQWADFVAWVAREVEGGAQ